MEQDTSQCIKPMVLFLGLTEKEILYSQNMIKTEPLDSFESPTKRDGNLNTTGPYDIKMDVQIKEDVDTESIQGNNTNVSQHNKYLHAATKRKPLLNMRLESDDVALNSKDMVQNSTEIDSILYGDHQIKEEMVIGPTVLQRAINQYTDTPEKLPEMCEDIDDSNKENNSLSSNSDKHKEQSLCDKNINKKISIIKNDSSSQSHKSLDLEKISSLALNSKNKILLSEAINSILFEDHIKEEIVIGPTVLQKRINQYTETPEKFTETYKEVDDSNEENNSLSANIDKHLEQPCDKENNNRKSNNKNNTSTQSHKSLHFKKSSSQSEFICDYCLKSVETKIQLFRHIRKEHNNNRLSSYQCKTCDKKFKVKKSFKKHLRSHEVQKDSPQCKICFKTFTLIVNMRRHIKQFHDKTIDYQCDQCQKTFERKDYLLAHLRAIHLDKSKIHNSSNGSNFICNICQRSYPDKERLKRHLRYHRRKSNPRINKTTNNRNKSTKFCDFCNKGFPEKRCLIGHMKIHMEITLPFPCEICGKKYAYSESLSKHLISHSKKYMFNCKVCNEQFRSKWGCQVHERKCVLLLRNSNNKLTCEICNREFEFLGSLSRHRNKSHKNL